MLIAQMTTIFFNWKQKLCKFATNVGFHRKKRAFLLIAKTEFQFRVEMFVYEFTISKVFQIKALLTH